MAYDYQMGGDYYQGETEEERRRRLEAEAAAAGTGYGGTSEEDLALFQGQAPTGGAATQQPSLGDLASQYLGRRVDAAQQPVADVGMTPQPDPGNTEVQSQQVKTYADGSQEEIVKRQMPAPAPEPVAPTAMPPAPTMAPAAAPQTQPVAQTQASVAQSQMAPAAPISPEETARQQDIVRAVQQQAQNLPQPGPGVQVAGPMVQGAVAGPVVQQAPASAPGASLAQAGQVAQTQPTRPQWAVDLEAAGNDQTKLIDIAANKAYPEDVRNDAKTKLRTAMANADAEAQAQKTVQGMAQGDPKAQNAVLQAMKASSIKRDEGKVTEGSYIRAYLYSRLGLNDLAKEEQEKIMGRAEYSQVSLGKEKYEVTTNKRTGQITSARDSQGVPVETPILNRIRAESLKVSTAQLPSAGAQRIRDSEGTEFSVVPTPQGSTFYNNKGEQGVPKGRTVPIAVGSDLEIAQAKEDIQTVAKFGQQTAVARIKAFENTNAKRADRSLPLLSLDEMGLRADGSLASEDVRRPGTGVATPPSVPTPVAPTPVTPVAAAQRPAPAVTPVTTPAPGTPPLVSTGGPVAGGGGAVRTPAGGIPTAQAMEQQSKEGDLERSTREAQIKDRNKSNQDYSDELAKSRASATAQNSTINRIQSSIDRNPEFFGIDTNSGVWRAYVDLNSTNEKKAESLNTLARNLNIPAAKRAQFDQTMNDYRNLQVNSITGSGLSASQTNSEKESQRVVGTVGSISDRPAAAKATLEYAKAKIAYTDAKARAFADERRTNPGMDRLAFEANFDAKTGEKIFTDANERMSKILGQAPGGATTVSGTTKTVNGVTYVYDGRGWKPQ